MPSPERVALLADWAGANLLIRNVDVDEDADADPLVLAPWEARVLRRRG